MTCIAWDGKTLAADKMSCAAGYGYTVTKVHRLKDGAIAAVAGDADGAMALLAWLDSERAHSDYPPAQKDNETSAFVVRANGSKASYGKGPHPIPVECEIFAMGHGRDFALAAMHCGRTAREAVELACKLDVYCGNGIDTLTL